MPAGGSLAARGRDTDSDAVYSRICSRPRAKGRNWIRMSSHPPAVPPRLLSGRVAHRVRAAAAPFSQSEGCASIRLAIALGCACCESGPLLRHEHGNSKGGAQHAQPYTLRKPEGGT
ncbi:hypothetical protein MRX96_029991 [Rhipicephalus microplus]